MENHRPSRIAGCLHVVLTTQSCKKVPVTESKVELAGQINLRKLRKRNEGPDFWNME